MIIDDGLLKAMLTMCICYFTLLSLRRINHQVPQTLYRNQTDSDDKSDLPGANIQVSPLALLYYKKYTRSLVQFYDATNKIHPSSKVNNLTLNGEYNDNAGVLEPHVALLLMIIIIYYYVFLLLQDQQAINI